MAFIWSFIENLMPTVKAQDDDDLVDPQEVLRGKCAKLKKCVALHDILNECTDRVNSKQNTTETCMEEVIDYVSCVDHCAAQTLFHHLK